MKKESFSDNVERKVGYILIAFFILIIPIVVIFGQPPAKTENKINDLHLKNATWECIEGIDQYFKNELYEPLSARELYKIISCFENCKSNKIVNWSFDYNSCMIPCNSINSIPFYHSWRCVKEQLVRRV